MKGIRSIISGALAACLVISILPQSVLATESAETVDTAIGTELVCSGTAECIAQIHEDHCEKKIAADKAAADQNAVDAVSALIAALPSLEDIQEKPFAEQQADYNQVQTAYTAYEQLTVEQKALITSAESLFENYFNYFNSLVAEADVVDEEHIHAYNLDHRCECGAIGGTCGENLTWEFDEENGILTIKGTGSMYEYADGYVDGKTTPPWADGGRDRIKHVVIEEGVTTISDAAFCGFEKIQSVSIASTVESIGGIAFEYCYSLDNIVLPDRVTSIGVSAFLDCRQLSSVVIGSEMETIGGFAFGGCSSLKTITFSGNAPSFGGYPNDVFCDVTATAYYPADNTTWTETVRKDYGGTITWVPYGDPATSGTCGENLTWSYDEKTATLVVSGTGVMDDFDDVTIVPWQVHHDMIKSVVVGEGVTSIGDGAFFEHSALKTVSIPTTITEIPIGVFSDCVNLESITVTTGNAAYLSENGILFDNNRTVLIRYPSGKSDTNYRIPDTVMEIQDYAFYNCDKLSTIRMHDRIQRIGYYAFADCGLLRQIQIPDSVIELGTSAFSDCSNLVSVEIGKGITDIEIYVFNSCLALEEVILPDTLINIWECAFYGCTSLKNIQLPANMNCISDAAFSGCTALENIVIGGVKEIWKPFGNCTALKKVTFMGDAPSYCTDAFQTLTLTAYHPDGNTTWTDAVKQSFGGNVTWVAMATSGTCGEDMTWSYNAGTLTISGTGAMYDYSKDQTNPAPWNHLTDDITKLVIEEGVTEIGDFAFMNCSVIENASFPSTLTRVGEYAFYRFSRPDGNVYHRPFWSEINQTVRQWSQIQFEADNEGFPGWDTTTFVHHVPIIASGIFGDRVFWELNKDGTMEVFGTGNMYEFGATGSPCGEMPVKTVTIGEGITNIGANIFEGWGTVPLTQTFESITIASTVKRVEEMAFTDCKALKTITFTGDAPTFGSNSFRNVTATAYYPFGNASWTTAVMQDYEGNITWESYCLDVHDFGEWITEGDESYRICELCGYRENKVITNGGDVSIESSENPELDFDVEHVESSDDRYILVEETIEDALTPESGTENEILKAFDITLKDEDGVHVQPGGTVKVMLPLDWDREGNYKVYRVNEDGTLTDMNAYRQGSHMVFETDHFSIYVIVENVKHSHKYQKEVTPPTCTEKGYTTYTCACGATYTADEIAAAGHTYKNGTCTVCGDKNPNYGKPNVPSWGDIWDWIFGNWKEDVCEHNYTSVVTDPTCSKKGYTSHSCTKCGDSYRDSYTDATGHTWNEGTLTRRTTCTKNGEMTYTCGVCNRQKKEVIKAIGHQFESGACVNCGQKESIKPNVSNMLNWGDIWIWIFRNWWK